MLIPNPNKNGFQLFQLTSHEVRIGTRDYGMPRPSGWLRLAAAATRAVTIQVVCLKRRLVRTRNPAQPNRANRRPLFVSAYTLG